MQSCKIFMQREVSKGANEFSVGVGASLTLNVAATWESDLSCFKETFICGCCCRINLITWFGGVDRGSCKCMQASFLFTRSLHAASRGK
uniref:Uncharacterized protein n=1 Tax=Rhizophora mucronata TaxID=61149 RepID=A0A2P2N458_RHIMU